MIFPRKYWERQQFRLQQEFLLYQFLISFLKAKFNNTVSYYFILDLHDAVDDMNIL